MTTEQFTYWLQGFFEISDNKKLNEKQVQIIKDHLALVFEKQTPDRKLLFESLIKEQAPLDSDEKQKLMFEPDKVRDSKRWNLGDESIHRPLCNTIQDGAHTGVICTVDYPKGTTQRGPTIYC